MCVYTWAWRAAGRAAWRFEQLQDERGLHRRPRHVIVSPEAQVVYETKDELDARFRAVFACLGKMAFLGGAVAYHPERHTRRDCWFDGPHFHVLGWGRVDADLRPGGWFVKVKRGEQRSIRGTIAYVLNHCGVTSRGHALRWFGIAAYNKTPVGPWPGEDLKMCRMCGAPLQLIAEVIARDGTVLNPSLEVIGVRTWEPA